MVHLGTVCFDFASVIEPSNFIELPGSIELEPVRVWFVRSLINRLKNCFKYIHSMFELAELTQNTLQIHLKSIQF